MVSCSFWESWIVSHVDKKEWLYFIIIMEVSAAPLLLFTGFGIPLWFLYP